MKIFHFNAILISLFCCGMAHAQEAVSNSNSPIEITATKDVEWQRNDKKYIAREDVIVKQGNITIMSDLLTADYRDGATSSMEIWQMVAEGNVTIADENNTAYGERGVYDVDSGVATLTGQNLKLVSPDQTVTASEKMEYFANEKKARAVGNAKVVRTQDTLTANTITAFFKQDNGAAKPAAQNTNSPLGGSGNLDRLEADGNVVIKTPTETLTGKKAIFKADTNTAELVGKVKVVRDKNVLEGERAEVNLTTNVSKMFGSKSENGRVRGVFFPGSSKKPSDPAKTAPEAKTTPIPPPQPEPVAPPTTAQKMEIPPKTPLAPSDSPARVSPYVKY